MLSNMKKNKYCFQQRAWEILSNVPFSHSLLLHDGTMRQSLHEINLCWPCANCFEARPLILDPNEISGCEKPGELVLTWVLTIHLILMRISPQCWRSHCSVFCICLLIIGNSKKQISWVINSPRCWRSRCSVTWTARLQRRNQPDPGWTNLTENIQIYKIYKLTASPYQRTS